MASTKAKFTSLPIEMQLEIIGHSCTSNQSIQPMQFVPHTSQFCVDQYHASFEPNFDNTKRSPLPPALVAYDVTNICKAIHHMVKLDKLFYSRNVFELKKNEDMAKFIGAMKPSDRDALKSVKFTYNYLGDVVPGLVLLQTCRSIAYLEIDISQCYGSFANTGSSDSPTFDQLKGFQELNRIRGLKKVKLNYGHDNSYLVDFIVTRVRGQDPTEANLIAARKDLELIQDLLTEELTKRRGAQPVYSPQQIHTAMEHAGINFSPPISIQSTSLNSVNNAVDEVPTNPYPDVDFEYQELSDEAAWAIMDQFN